MGPGSQPEARRVIECTVTVTPSAVCERYPDFANFLSEETDAEMIERLRGAETIGRPLGSRKFLDTLERKTRRVLSPAKRGPKPRRES